jgi:phosphoribosylformimino-5-aminoimidazole carboxamide ribonucleotide (ProFAR) isomerase
LRPSPEIQVIDLDVAMGRGSNGDLVRSIAAKAVTRVGGGGPSVERAQELAEQGARKVIPGTAAFSSAGGGCERQSWERQSPDWRANRQSAVPGVNAPFLRSLGDAIGRERVIVALDSRAGRIVVRGWQESTDLTAESVIEALAPYCSGFLCTYVDKEGMLSGTDLEWSRRPRAATPLEITAAGGITTLDDVRALMSIDVHAALGMAIYTGPLCLEELAGLLPGYEAFG